MRIYFLLFTSLTMYVMLYLDYKLMIAICNYLIIIMVIFKCYFSVELIALS